MLTFWLIRAKILILAPNVHNHNTVKLVDYFLYINIISMIHDVLINGNLQDGLRFQWQILENVFYDSGEPVLLRLLQEHVN